MARFILAAFSMLVLVYLLVPLIIIVGASLTTSEFLTFPPQGLTLKWYERVLADRSYMAAFSISTWLALSATVIALLLAVPATLAIARFQFRGKGVVEAVLMSPLMMPYLVLGAALLQYGSAIGLVRSFPALMVGHVVIIVPFIVRSVLPQFSADQKALEEASRDLGAGPFATFFLVTLPQIRGGAISGAILAFITSWINVELSIFNVTPALTTIPVKLFNYIQYTIDPTIAAVSAITILVAAILLLIIDAVFGLDVIQTKK